MIFNEFNPENRGSTFIRNVGIYIDTIKLALNKET